MTTLLTVSVILFGVLAYLKLPVNDLPAVDYPVITVQVSYPGANPTTMANNVATPLERQFILPDQRAGARDVVERPGTHQFHAAIQFE